MPAFHSLLEHYVRAYHPQLLRVATAITKDRYLAEDVVQKAYMKFAPRIAEGRVTDEHDGKGLLFKITTDESKSAVRKRQRDWKRDNRWFDLTRRTASEDPIDAAALSEELRSALAQLSEKQRSVIALRFLGDLSEEETAAVLGMRLGTMKSHSSRGLARLEALLGSAKTVGGGDS